MLGQLTHYVTDLERRDALEFQRAQLGRGDDAVGNPNRAQFSQFELFELILLLKLDKQLHVEQFEATVSHSVNSTLPPL